MNVYKEIFIELDKSAKTNPTDLDFYTTSEFKGKGSLSYENRRRGFIFSFGNSIISGKIEFNILYLTFLKLKNEKFDKGPHFLRRYRIVFPDLVLDNVHHFEDMDKNSYCNYSFFFFTVNGKIFNFYFSRVFDNDCEFSKSEGEFDKNLDIIITEYLSSDAFSYYYALGSGNGKFYITRIHFKQGYAVTEILYEYKSSFAFTKYIGSFFTNEKYNCGISYLKNIGNDMICFITNDFNFNIFSRYYNKIVFNKCLVKNKKNETVKYSKIDYINNEFNIDISYTKSYFFTVYVEYDIFFLQLTFEIWFANIEINPSVFMSHSNEEKSNYLNKINLGENVSLTNFRVYNLKGKLIDMIAYQKKIWIISENNSMEGFNYDFKIISINKSGKFKNLINFSEMKINNTMMNLLTQIKFFNDKERKNQLILSILSNEDFLQSEFLLDFWNNSFPKMIKNTILPKFIQKQDLLAYLSKLQEKSEILEKIVENIHEIMSNEICCLGSIFTGEISSLVILRNNGFSYIKETGKFEYLNELITIHESRISDIIYEKKYFYKISNTFTKNQNQMKQRIFNYIMLNKQQREDNSFYIILSLLRLTMSESIVKTSDYNYIFKYFSSTNASLKKFIEEHFSDSVTSNQVSNVEFLNDFIYSSIINNIHIELIIEKLINYFIEYLGTVFQYNINYEIEKSNEIVRYNSKYCEVISKLIDEKVKSMYNLSRDLLMLICWLKKFSDINLITNPNTALFNLVSFRKIYDKYYEKIQCLFIDCFSAYLICFTQINISKLRGNSNIHFAEKKLMNFDISFSEFVLYRKIDIFGIKIFEDFSKNIIDYLISYFWSSFKILDRPKLNTDMLNTLFFEFEDYKCIRLLLTVNRDQNIENIWYLILSNAYLHDIDLMKECINLFYSKVMDEFTSVNNLNAFENFLVENKFIQRPSSERLSHPLLIVYQYLDDILKKILKEEDEKFQFYHFSSFYIIPLFSKTEKKKNSEYLYHMFELSLKMDVDCAISCLISITEEYYIDKAYESLVEYFCQKNNIESLLNYNFDKKQYEKIFTVLERKSQTFIKHPESIISSGPTPTFEDNVTTNSSKINYLSIFLSLLLRHNDLCNYTRVLCNYIINLYNLLERGSYNLPQLTVIFKTLITCIDKIKKKDKILQSNFMLLFNDQELFSYEKCLKLFTKIRAKYYLLKWNEGSNKFHFKQTSIMETKLDQRTITDDNLMVDFICSKSFEEELITFLCETNYLEYLTEEASFHSFTPIIKKIFNAVIHNNIVPTRKELFKLDFKDVGNDEKIHLYKVNLNHNIYDLSDESFITFFENVLKKIPYEYALIFAELVLEKDLDIPEILKNYLSEYEMSKKEDVFKNKDSMDIDISKTPKIYSINYMRLLLKYRKFEDCFNMICNLIISRNHLPVLELNMLAHLLESQGSLNEKDKVIFAKLQEILSRI